MHKRHSDNGNPLLLFSSHTVLTIKYRIQWISGEPVFLSTCKKRKKMKLTQLWLVQVPQLKLWLVQSPQLQSAARNHQATRNRRHMAKIKPELRLAQVSPPYST
jgi:hypothetical protein